MYAENFYYNGEMLSDYGFIIGSFDGSDLTEQSTGSIITFNRMPYYGGRKYSLTSIQYDSCFECTFDIVKAGTDKIITGEEYRDIGRWLNRKAFYPFRFIDDIEAYDVWFNASFNISQLVYSGHIVGIRLTMTTDAPYGYGDEITQRCDFTTNTAKKKYIESDDYGFFIPDIVITCKADGNISLYNQTAGETMQIANCTNNEVITIKGREQIITSSINHNVYDDFNYRFLKIGNTPDNPYNVIVSQGAANVTDIIYKPIIKNIV